jgi:hypothetical protein
MKKLICKIFGHDWMSMTGDFSPVMACRRCGAVHPFTTFYGKMFDNLSTKD